MANFFDQFDVPAPPIPPQAPAPRQAPEGSNFFDQFDAAPAAVPEVVDPVMEAATRQEPNGFMDAVGGFGTGLVEGAVETAMLPVTVGRLAEDGLNAVFNTGESALRAALGMDPVSEDEWAERNRMKGEMPSINAALFQGQDAVRGVVDDVLPDPETKVGEYTNMIGQFAVPGGIPSKATRAAPTVVRKVGEYAEDLARNAVLPAVVAQGVGDVPGIDGTAAEPWAEMAGAVVGGGASALYKAANAPESVVRRAVGNPDDVDWARARALQQNSTGVALTGPEAISQAQGGASALPDVMRVVEGSIDGGPVMAPFFSKRAEQVQNAANSTFDTIAPQSTQPSALGPRVSGAAEEVIDGVRQDINASTRPLYRAAEPQLIPDAEFAPIGADPRFQAAVARLRGNPEIAPDFANMPDNSIAIVDAAVKDMFARGEAMSVASNPIYGPYLGSLNSSGATTARNTATSVSPEYAQALAEQAQLRQTQLAPLENGPLGQIAAANTTQEAGAAILPRNPLVGSEDETMDAITRLLAQDSDATPQLIRQTMADRFNSSLTETQQGAQDFAGAKFHKDLVGNPQREATLDAVLEALNNPDAAAAFPEMLDVFQATGRRKPIGSATEFNRTINSDLGSASPFARTVDLAKSLGTSWITNVGDATKRAAQRNSTRALAQMFTDPDAVDLIRMALMKGPKTNLAEALLRTGAQTAPTVSGGTE